MSEKVKRYREMYKRGLVTIAQLDKLVQLKVLTEKEKQQIIVVEEV